MWTPFTKWVNTPLQASRPFRTVPVPIQLESDEWPPIYSWVNTTSSLATDVDTNPCMRAFQYHWHLCNMQKKAQISYFVLLVKYMRSQCAFRRTCSDVSWNKLHDNNTWNFKIGSLLPIFPSSQPTTLLKFSERSSDMTDTYLTFVTQTHAKVQRNDSQAGFYF